MSDPPPSPAPAPFLVLASGSPRRRELLAAAGYRFRVQPSPVDDDRDPPPGIDAAALVEERSREKARAVAAACPGEWVLGADTAVEFAGRLYGKPADRADAEATIRTLMGNNHRVVSGVTLISPAGRELVRHGVSVVRIEPADDARLDAFLAGGLWRGKAGAYGIQDAGGLDVQLVGGGFSNVVGLPMEVLADMLAEAGFGARR